MAKQRLLFVSAQRGLWVLLVFLLECRTVLQNTERTTPCPFPGEPAPSWTRSLSLKELFMGNWSHRAGEESDNDNFQETLVTRDSGREADHGQSRKKRQKRGSECACQCRMSDRAKAGRHKVRPCRLQWKFFFSPFFPPDSRCRSFPLSFSGTSEPSRRCRKLKSASWNVDSTPNAKGQAERKKLRCPDFHKGLAACCPGALLRGCASRHDQHLLLTSESQRHPPRGRGKGSVVSHILVSLAAACLLLLGDHPGQKTLTGLKHRLLRLLPGPAVNGDEGLQTGASRSPVRGSRAHRSVRARELCSCSKEAKESLCFAKTPSKSSFSVFSDCYMSTTLFAPFTRLWVAPAMQFLPSATSQDSAHLDHLGYRLATMAVLPPSCTLSRVRLADAGFHFNPSANTSAVLCHQCSATYSLTQGPGGPAPLEFHRSASPGCSVVRQALERLRGFTSASASAFGASDRGNRQDVGEDGEERTERSRRSGRSGTLQSSASVITGDAGYVLALAGSDTDQRKEPRIFHQAPGTDTGSSSSPSSSSSRSSEAARHSQNDRRGSGRRRVSLGEVVYPQFSNSEARLRTFSSWPAVMATTFPAQLMVNHGFYYAGYADCVRCFYCGVGLKSWEAQDDALTEHVRWRAECGFLLATRGRQCIQRVQSLIDGASGAQNTGNERARGPSSDRSSVRDSDRESVSAQEGGATSVDQQLITMGFLSKDIDSVRARLRTSGESENLEQIVEILLSAGNG